MVDIDQLHTSISRGLHQLDDSRTQTVTTVLPSATCHETAKRFQSPRPGGREKECNTKTMRVPFSDWLQDVAVSLRNELMPCFEELGTKLDGHMENVKGLIAHQQMEFEGRIDALQTAEQIRGSAQAEGQESICQGFPSLATWAEPDSPGQPQSPPAPADRHVGNPDEVSAQPTWQEEALPAASDFHSPPRPDRTMFRKSVEAKWMGHVISQASKDLDHMKASARLRERIANHIGVSSMSLTETNTGYLKMLVNNEWFTSFWTFMIVADAMNTAVGAHTAILRRLAIPPDPPPGAVFEYIEIVLASLFLLEIILRMCAWKWAFFLGTSWKENIAEAVLVVFTFVMDVARVKNEWARLARSLRLARVIREIMKTKKLLSLRFMMSSMLNCGPTLLWAIVVIGIVLSFFSVLFMQVALDWLRELLTEADTSEHEPVIDLLREHYNGYFVTMVSLFMAVTGGSDWRDLYLPLWNIKSSLGMCFLCYICVMVLGVFNVLVGVCADRAFAASRGHQDFVADEERKQMVSLMKDVREMFKAISPEGSEKITLEQFLSCQEDSRISSFFRSHQMNMIEPTWLFNMLDKDGSGCMTLSELAVGLLRLSGQARSSDMLLLVALTLEMRDEMVKLRICTEKKDTQSGSETPFETALNIANTAG